MIKSGPILKKRWFRLTLGIAYVLLGLGGMLFPSTAAWFLFYLESTSQVNSEPSFIEDVGGIVVPLLVWTLLGIACLSVGVFHIWTADRYSRSEQNEEA